MMRTGGGPTQVQSDIQPHFVFSDGYAPGFGGHPASTEIGYRSGDPIPQAGGTETTRYIDATWKASRDSTSGLLDARNGTYYSWTNRVNLRPVWEFGFICTFGGAVEVSVEYGHTAASPLLTFADRTAAGNGFFEFVMWSDPCRWS